MTFDIKRGFFYFVCLVCSVIEYSLRAGSRTSLSIGPLSIDCPTSDCTSIACRRSSTVCTAVAPAFRERRLSFDKSIRRPLSAFTIGLLRNKSRQSAVNVRSDFARSAFYVTIVISSITIMRTVITTLTGGIRMRRIFYDVTFT